MSGNLFLSIHKPIEEAAKIIFTQSLGINTAGEGDSLNVYGGIYYQATMFGAILRLEMNDYEYSDRYDYWLYIREDFLAGFKVDDAILDDITRICLHLLVSRGFTVGYEDGKNALQEYSLSHRPI